LGAGSFGDVDDMSRDESMRTLPADDGTDKIQQD
jgi:hypothetical protein